MSSPNQSPSPPTHNFTLFGVSHHPDYNITTASSSPHFLRNPHGDRLAPLSQLNSFRGRALANTTSSSPSSSPTPSFTRLAAFDFEAGATPSPSPRMYTVSHDTSHDFPTPTPPPRTHPRPVSTTSVSHPHARCQSRRSTSRPDTPLTLLAPPPPRVSVPPMVKCAGCVLVPGYLGNEFRRVWDACRVCGQLTGEGVQELVMGGEVEGVSREMREWVGEVVWEWGEVVGLRKGRGRGV